MHLYIPNVKFYWLTFNKNDTKSKKKKKPLQVLLHLTSNKYCIQHRTTSLSTVTISTPDMRTVKTIPTYNKKRQIHNSLKNVSIIHVHTY